MFKKSKQMSLDDPRLLRVKITPQMLDYDQFSNRGRSQYLPYIMSFNAPSFKSASINTDHLGFRVSYDSKGNPFSVGTLSNNSFKEVNLLIGASPSLGYGATSDKNTVSSRLSAMDPDGVPWLNFSGHCFNAVQELMLFILHSHRLPKIKNIVIMSGFNTLVMSRLPDFIRGELPPFYFCGEYYDKFDEIAEDNGSKIAVPKRPKWPKETTDIPPIEETIIRASNESLRCLKTWKQLSDSMGAELSYFMQPLATWVRKPCNEEQGLFNELDQLSKLGTWKNLYGDISEPKVADAYADKLAAGCQMLDIKFGNLVNDLRDIPSKDWLFVDRAHFTDFGNDIVAQAIHQHIK